MEAFLSHNFQVLYNKPPNDFWFCAPNGVRPRRPKIELAQKPRRARRALQAHACTPARTKYPYLTMLHMDRVSTLLGTLPRWPAIALHALHPSASDSSMKLRACWQHWVASATAGAGNVGPRACVPIHTCPWRWSAIVTETLLAIRCKYMPIAIHPIATATLRLMATVTRTAPAYSQKLLRAASTNTCRVSALADRAMYLLSLGAYIVSTSKFNFCSWSACLHVICWTGRRFCTEN